MRKYKIFTACLITFVLVLFSSFTSLAAKMPRLIDDADLLTDSQEKEIISILDSKSEENEFDIAILTVDYADYSSIESFADDFYDDNGYGYGNDFDGVIFVVNMADSEWTVSTCGSGENIIDDIALDEIEEICIPYLSAGDYYSAFTSFINITEEYIVDYNTFPFISNLFFSVVVGFVLSLIVVSVMKSKLKSVRKQIYSGAYMKENSFAVAESRDVYLYSHVTRTAKPKNNSSSHTSSSGRSHGGRSGKF